MKAYVRKAEHSMVFSQSLITSLDIAAVEVYQEYRGQGKFKDFLNYAHEINPWQATYVESVNSDRLRDFLFRDHWQAASTPFCFFKPKI